MDNITTKYCMPRVKGSQLSCTLVGSLGVLFNLRDTAVLLHGTTGCAHYGVKFCQQMMMRGMEIMPGYQLPPVNFSTTALSENELIFGGEDQLSEKISEMLEAYPDLPLLVIPSCIVEVIGDDVQGVCERMSRETGRTVIYFNMGGFLKGDHYQGVNTTYFDLIDRFLTPSPRIEPQTVNLVAERGLMPAAEIDFLEIRRLLAKLDLSINTRFVRHLAFADLPRVTGAALNLPSVSNQSMAICQRLSERFGMPFLREGFPSGFADTRHWIEAIGDSLSLDVDIDALMREEWAFFHTEIHRLGNPLKGLKVIVNTFPIHMGWLTEFLDAVGVDLMEINILDSGYFQSDFIDNPGALSWPVNGRMRFEDVLANNLDTHADLILQCSVHYSPMPNHQPGLLIKEVPVVPPVGPRGLLNLFVNWSQWMRSRKVEGWRNEPIESLV
jgi:nitrogenase molybdenum-iron protein alpha/beta subunit